MMRFLKRLRYILLILCLIGMGYPFYHLYQSYQTLAHPFAEQKWNKPTYRIMLITPTMDDPYWEQVHTEISKFASSHNILLEVRSGYRLEVAEMVKQIRMAIASKVDGLIVLGMDHPEFVQAVNEATEKGIPVMTVGADVSQSLRKMYVGTDHTTSGKALAQLVVKELDGNGDVGMIGSKQSNSLQALRREGLRSVFSQTPNIRLIEQLYDPREGHEASDTMEQTNQLLNRNPQIEAIVILNGTEVEQVLRIIRQRVRTSQIKIYTFSDTPKAQELFQKKYLNGLIVYDPRQMGAESIRYLVDWLEGKQLPLPDHVYTPFALWSAEKKVHVYANHQQ